MKGGVQSVTTKVTQITIPFYGKLCGTQDGPRVILVSPPSVQCLSIYSLYYATWALFMGNVSIDLNGSLVDNIMGQPSFLEILPVPDNSSLSESTLSTQFVWGDVIQGIEEMSHNVTAALLTLQLGNISSECFSDQQTVVYQYSSFALWVPYGVSHFSLLSCYDFHIFPHCDL